LIERVFPEQKKKKKKKKRRRKKKEEEKKRRKEKTKSKLADPIKEANTELY